MDTDDEFSDDLVAQLLIQDAARATRVAAVQPRSAGTLKPNKAFLGNILRGANRHNDALLARGKDGARHRWDRQAKEPASSDDLRGTHVHDSERHDSSRRSKRRRLGEDEDGRSRRRSEHGERGRERSHSPRRGHDGSPDSIGSEEHRRSSRHSKRRQRPSTQAEKTDDDHKQRRHRDGRHQSQVGRRDRQRHRKDERSMGPESGPEGEEDFIGPPEATHADFERRGRGSRKALNRAAMDGRLEEFDGAGYDESDKAREKERDRDGWAKQGAERLRAAGFGEEVISRWKEAARPRGSEADIDSVRWKSKGEGREWDRGKVVVEDARGEGRMDVELRASWAKSNN